MTPLMFDLIQHLATLLIGLYAGSLLTEGTILVPYWRRMAPADFFRLHANMGPNLFRYFAPLTTAAVAMSLVAALVAGSGAVWRLAAAALCVAALAIFFLHFRKANAAFAAHSIPDDQLAPALARWAAWHWLRTIIVVGALAAAIVACGS